MTSGLIFDIKRFAVHDGPGIRTTIFFKGCPLTCWWCHNPESRSNIPQHSLKHVALDGQMVTQEEISGSFMTVSMILGRVERDRVFYEESGGGVTLSGGEPLFQIDFCTDLLRSLKKNGFHTALDTTGYANTKDFHRILPYTDLFLYDLKLLNPSQHLRYTGVSNQVILHHLKLLFQEGKCVIIRFPVIPGITDSDENIESTVGYLEELNRDTIEIHLLPYHRTAKNKYIRFGMEEKMEPTATIDQGRIEGIKERMERSGFCVKTGG